MGNTTVIASFNTIQEAMILKGMLEANDIPAFISDHNNLYVPVFGGVDVVIYQRDREKAQSLIDAESENN